MNISIQTNFPDVKRALDGLSADVGNKAMASALNKTVAQAKTAMSREIRAVFNMSASKVAESLTITRAVATGGRFSLSARLESKSKRGRSLNLINFMERSTSMAQARKRGKAGTLKQLFVQIKKVGGKKALGSAFIGNQGRTVFVRTGKARLPIKALQTIDVPNMFNTKRVNAKVLRFINDKFPELFKNEAKYFTSKFNQQSAAPTGPVGNFGAGGATIVYR